MPMPNRELVLSQNKELVPEIVEVLVQNVTWPLEAFPVGGAVTVQFASPGAQLGFSVSPGRYGLVGGEAKSGVATRRHAIAAPTSPPIVNCTPKTLWMNAKNF